MAGSWLRRLLGRTRPKARPEPRRLLLGFSTADEFAAFLSDPRARKRYAALELSLEPWFAARPDWTGRLGPLPGLLTATTSFDAAGRRARVAIEVADPLRGYELVRAAYAACYPTRAATGWGCERVAVAPGATVAQAWEPGGGLRPLYPGPSKKKYTDFEAFIDAEGEHWLGEHPEPPVLRPRPDAPQVLIDPKVHRPLERRQPSDITLSATAQAFGERLVISSGGRTLLEAPLAAPLTATGLRQLELVTDLDAAGLGTGPDASRRVAELAAYGAIVHHANPGLELDPALAALVEAPFARCGLLDHMNRSQAQVRTVMTRHTSALTRPESPTVSVILSTQRPNLLPQILSQLAAQDHPRLEVVIGCHGFPAPAPESFATEVQPILGPILSFAAETRFGDVLAGLSAAASGDFISKVDDDDWYGPHHLTDLLAAWTYSEAQLVGKKLALVHFESDDTLVVRRFFLEGYRWQVAGGAAIMARGDLAAVGGWRSQRRAVDRGLWTQVMAAGGLAYSCSGPGYVHVRHAEPHTWNVDDRHFRESYAEATLIGIPPAALGIG